MEKNLPQIKNFSLVGFGQRLTIVDSLLQRIETDDEEIYFNFRCGKQALIDDRYSEAIQYFNTVISLVENNSLYKGFKFDLGKRIPVDEYINSYLLRGNIFFKLVDTDSAIVDYSKCIELDSSNSSSFRNRAICFLKNNQFIEALEDLMKITKMKEFCPEIYRLIAYCYHFQKQFEKARIHFKISASQKDKESQKIIDNGY